MEWCWNVYEGWGYKKYADGAFRILPLIAVVCLAVVWITFSPIPEKTMENTECVEKSDAAFAVTCMAGNLSKKNAAAAAGSFTVPVMENDAVHVEEAAELPVIDKEEKAIVPEISIMHDDVIIPDTSIVQEEEQDMNIPADERIPDDPDISEETGIAPMTVDGFLVDENGVIYGVDDPDMAVKNGVLKLPSEQCTGITSTAFSAGMPSVVEVYIPANITDISPGAFSALTNVEWYSVEPGSLFTEKMGVLLSENGTCVFAFPSGRTGNYKVPSGITSFGQNAFLNASISALDVTACTAADLGDLPDRIQVIQRGTQVEAY